MKKLIARGFSLAELLLCIAIIGVVSAMGLVITKHSADKAYDLFYYTAYVNLYNAIAEYKATNNGNMNANGVINLLDISNGVSITSTNENGNTIFTVRIPQRKTRTNNGVATTRLAYVDEDSGYLIPVAGGTVDLQNRRDLLPVYVDNGIVGRNNVIDRSNNSTFNPGKIRYATYKDAFCTIRSNNGINGVISCSGANNVTPSQGYLKFASPLKAR